LHNIDDDSSNDHTCTHTLYIAITKPTQEPPEEEMFQEIQEPKKAKRGKKAGTDLETREVQETFETQELFEESASLHDGTQPEETCPPVVKVEYTADPTAAAATTVAPAHTHVKPEPAASVEEQKPTPKAAPQPQPASSVSEQKRTPKAAPQPQPAASVNEERPTPEAAPALTADVSPEAKGSADAEEASKCDKENMHTHIIALSNPFAQRTCHVTQYSHRPCCTSGAPQRR
jgi:hypothetical protein